MFSEVAALQTLLVGVDLPAEKRDLIEYARGQGGSDGVTRLLERLPDREYRSIDDVGEALAPVQPSSNHEDELPRPESGLPPGGDSYVSADVEPGGVRNDAPPENPPQKTIEQQTKTQNQQQEKQKEMLGDS